MSRYDLAGEGEDAFQPGSDGKVLRNKLGIVDPSQMDLVEARELHRAIDESLDKVDTSTQFSVESLCRMHDEWLGNIYEFAGKFRSVNVSKGGILFAPVANLDRTLIELDTMIHSNTPCEGFDLDKLVRSIALVHAEFILAHPFREGNGRLGRWLADLMALQAGFATLDWGFERNTEGQRMAYFTAMAKAFANEFRPLEALVSSALMPS